MYYDFHLHSNFSEDSTSPMEDMIKEGIKQNLKGMCFTEHTDLDFPGNNFTFLADLDAYEKTFLQLKKNIGLKSSFILVWKWAYSHI